MIRIILHSVLIRFVLLVDIIQRTVHVHTVSTQPITNPNRREPLLVVVANRREASASRATAPEASRRSCV